MALELIVPVHNHTDFTPKIMVIGVGGGGTNAVDNMIALDLQGVDFVVANTDAQQLQHSRAGGRVQLGPHLTQGLGAGAKPEIGRAAAEEAADELTRHLDGTHMVFITAGMGGGTGTGAAPVIARLARERNILTVGVVTKPFTFEGARRTKAADAGIAELQQYVDTLIVIPNQNLFRLANENTSWKGAFKMADNVLYMGVRGVTDLMVAPGLINLDFADIRTVMAEMGKAMMGTGEADGDNRAVRAAEAAINNPLLEDTSMAGARGLLINITGGDDMTLFEVDQAANRIREEVAEDANIIFGSAIDDNLNGRIRVSVVATGIDMGQQEAVKPRLVAVGGGGGGGLAQAVSAAPAGFTGPIPAGPALPPAASAQLLTPRPIPAEPAPQPEAHVQPQPAPAQPKAPPMPAQQRPAPSGVRHSSIFAESRHAETRPSEQPAAPPPAPAPGPNPGNRSLFGIMTGAMRKSRPAAPEPTEPQRADPSFPGQQATPPAGHRGEQADEALDIPAFLRRQQS